MEICPKLSFMYSDFFFMRVGSVASCCNYYQSSTSYFYAEAKKEFSDDCSVQVYSVQACIPKDPAALWNSEFVQAEELFRQPLSVDNCLLDNRYSTYIQSLQV